MKKKSKQLRHDQDKRRRREAERRRRQDEEQAEAQLWRELEPLTAGYNMEDRDEFIDFAAHVMHNSGTLAQEPEFADFEFDPADALLAELGAFNATVPQPEKLEQMPEDVRRGIVEEAQIRAVTGFITPQHQRDVLRTLGQCRQRFRQERKKDQLALAAAIEMILRQDKRAEIWAGCGILHMIFSKAMEQATAFQEATESALQTARAIQPEVEDYIELEKGTPAYEAFWKQVDETPGLEDYIDRVDQNADMAMMDTQRLNIELAQKLFDTDETIDWAGALAENLKAKRVDLEAQETAPPPEPMDEAALSKVLKAQITPERYQQMLDGLDDIINEADEFEPLGLRARILRDELKEHQPYWENLAFQQFCFGLITSDVINSTADSEDEDDFNDDEAA